ncbi:MAG: single-stranded-DNA-specific exonuclease RecJ [Clostridia bacterium]|nr:single-stranded-DNA-specific exonuclease RecJ [Clostridia bacterium]
MNKKWEICEKNVDLVKEIVKKHNISELLANILVNRNIINDDEIKIFLNPTRNDFHDPYLMPDMDKAVERIIEAIEKQEKTIIYGDYDVDGITSITVLKKFLGERGLNVGYRIPNRLEEGYGLNKKAIKEIADEGYKLIITVDCGISGTEEIAYAYSLGMEVIVTDHHEPLEILPEAVAIIDCKRKDNKYPNKNLAGVGVVFKLTQAISQKLELDEKEYLKYLDIVCIGTISDIVPLTDENRVIAKLGLKLVEKTRNPGLKALLNAIGFKEVNSNTVSFGIAPRINACGRMGHEEEALKLFLTDNLVEASDITASLNKYNRDRQEIEKRIFDEAITEIDEKNLNQNSAIVLGSENWHHGVIGIVASKITDMYFKPSILICFEGNEGKGSGRSVPGFDLHEALCESSKYLEKYGGHEMAVGLTLNKDKFEEFKINFETIAQREKVDEIISVVEVDKEITSNDINLKTVDDLKLLEPFGEANKMPVFIYKNLRIDSIRALSEGKHLKLRLKDGNLLIDAIGFYMGNYVEEFLLGDKVDVLGVLETNEFRGVKDIQINLKDIRKSY